MWEIFTATQGVINNQQFVMEIIFNLRTQCLSIYNSISMFGCATREYLIIHIYILYIKYLFSQRADNCVIYKNTM